MAPKNRCGMRRIIVADDNAEIRAFIFESLTADYEVSCVATGEELYALLCGCGALYDVVIVDIVMSCGDGPQNVECARLCGEVPPVIYISGKVSVTEVPEHAFGKLSKPFSVKSITTMVERAIAFSVKRKAKRAT